MEMGACCGSGNSVSSSLVCSGFGCYVKAHHEPPVQPLLAPSGPSPEHTCAKHDEWDYRICKLDSVLRGCPPSCWWYIIHWYYVCFRRGGAQLWWIHWLLVVKRCLFHGPLPSDSRFISGHDIEPWPGDVMLLECKDIPSFWNPTDQQMQEPWSG